MLVPSDGAPPDGSEIAASGLDGDNALSLFSQTISAISMDITRSVNELQGIASELARLSRTGGPLDRRQITHPLQAIYAEIQRQQSSLETVNSLAEKLSRTAARTDVPMASDPVSMLPGRADAERILALLLSRHQTAFIGLFYLQRLALVNSRFGTSVGDTLVSRFSRHLAKVVSKTDYLFRWAGAAFLGVFLEQTPLPAFSLQIDRHVGLRIVETIYVKDRTALIPMSCAWHVIEFSPDESLEETVSTIDSVFSDWQAGRRMHLRRPPA